MLLIFIAGLRALHAQALCARGVLVLKLECPSLWHTFSVVVSARKFIIYGPCKCVCVCECVRVCVTLSVCVCVCVCVCDLITHLYCAAVKSKAGESLGAKQMPGPSLHTLCCSTGVYTVNFSRV